MYGYVCEFILKHPQIVRAKPQLALAVAWSRPVPLEEIVSNFFSRPLNVPLCIDTYVCSNVHADIKKVNPLQRP